ncbi:unknown [Corallococcus sp. CAG:1435]|nr:unknown [Corallococcus sp. CAG:1435]
MPVAFTTNSIAPARESFSPFSVSCIAEIADGVAAFPTPRRLDASFNEMYCFATSDTLPYKKLLTGFRQRDSFSTRRHCSATLKMPIHRQYTPQSPNAVVSACAELSTHTESTLSGLTKVRKDMASIVVTVHTIFILYCS